MSEETLNFNNIRVNKKEFYTSNQQNDLKSVNLNQIVVSDKFKHNDEGFKCFIGYQEDEIVKRLCIILPQISGYIKYFEDDEVWEKYEQIWHVIKNKLGIKFCSKAVYDKTYIKAKVREFHDKIKTNFLGNEVPKENMHYTCIACITIDSVIKMGKKLSKSLFSRAQV